MVRRFCADAYLGYVRYVLPLLSPTYPKRVSRMQHAEVLEAIRQLARDAFSNLGAHVPVEISENILIRDEMYCGRRFQCGELHAIWFVEEDEIKIYGENGALERVTSASEALSSAPLTLSKAA